MRDMCCGPWETRLVLCGGKTCPLADVAAHTSHHMMPPLGDSDCHSVQKRAHQIIAEHAFSGQGDPNLYSCSVVERVRKLFAPFRIDFESGICVGTAILKSMFASGRFLGLPAVNLAPKRALMNPESPKMN